METDIRFTRDPLWENCIQLFSSSKRTGSNTVFTVFPVRADNIFDPVSSLQKIALKEERYFLYRFCFSSGILLTAMEEE